MWVLSMIHCNFVFCKFQKTGELNIYFHVSHCNNHNGNTLEQPRPQRAMGIRTLLVSTDLSAFPEYHRVNSHHIAIFLLFIEIGTFSFFTVQNIKNTRDQHFPQALSAVSFERWKRVVASAECSWILSLVADELSCSRWKFRFIAVLRAAER